MPNTYFTGVRAPWLPLYQQLEAMAQAQVGPFEADSSPRAIVWRANASIAQITAKKSSLTLSLTLEREYPQWHPSKLQQLSRHRFLNAFNITSEAQLPAMMERIAAAYALAKQAPTRPPKAKPTPFTTVDEYIALFPPETQAILQRVRAVIRAAAPEATERISWQMPTYHQHENLIHFAAQKHHLGLYPSPETIEAFQDRLAEYKTTKGGIQFPYAKGIPYDLIGEITKCRVQMVEKQYNPK